MDFFQEITDSIERGLYSLFDDPWLILMQFIATVILFVVIRIFLWKPITNYIDKRQTAINRELNEARSNNQRAQTLKADILKEYEAAKEETQKLKEILQKEAYDEKERIISEARSEAKRRLDQVEYDVRQEIKKANDRIKESVKSIAFAAAEKIVQHEIDEEAHEQMIDDLIEEKFR